MSGDTKKRTAEIWQTSIDLWKSGAVVTRFMEAQLAGLRSSNCEPLPEAVRAFLADLVFCRIKPRKGRAISRGAIRDAYRVRLMLENLSEPAEPKEPGFTPSERVIKSIADDLKLSERTISEIVCPRKSRLK